MVVYLWALTFFGNNGAPELKAILKACYGKLWVSCGPTRESYKPSSGSAGEGKFPENNRSAWNETEMLVHVPLQGFLTCTVA